MLVRGTRTPEEVLAHSKPETVTTPVGHHATIPINKHAGRQALEEARALKGKRCHT